VKIENRQKLLLIVAALAIGILAADRLVLTPLVRAWKDRSARITELRRSVTQGAQLLEREQTIRSRWHVMETNTLPTETSAAENTLLQAFDRWSEASRVSVTSLKPQWRPTDEDYVTLECRVDAAGSMSALSRFLFELENDPLALKVEALELSTRDNEGQQLQLAVQVSGLVLQLPTP
jgi:hypothetical protein